MSVDADHRLESLLEAARNSTKSWALTKSDKDDEDEVMIEPEKSIESESTSTELSSSSSSAERRLVVDVTDDQSSMKRSYSTELEVPSSPTFLPKQQPFAFYTHSTLPLSRDVPTPSTSPRVKRNIKTS